MDPYSNGIYATQFVSATLNDISFNDKRVLHFNFFLFSPTKACIIASIIFVLDLKTDLISAPHALVYFGIVIFFVYFKVSFCFNFFKIFHLKFFNSNAPNKFFFFSVIVLVTRHSRSLHTI